MLQKSSGDCGLGRLLTLGKPGLEGEELALARKGSSWAESSSQTLARRRSSRWKDCSGEGKTRSPSGSGRAGPSWCGHRDWPVVGGGVCAWRGTAETGVTPPRREPTLSGSRSPEGRAGPVVRTEASHSGCFCCCLWACPTAQLLDQSRNLFLLGLCSLVPAVGGGQSQSSQPRGPPTIAVTSPRLRPSR